MKTIVNKQACHFSQRCLLKLKSPFRATFSTISNLWQIIETSLLLIHAIRLIRAKGE